MSSILSKSSQYAIQAVMFLAAQPENHPVFQRDISNALNIPIHYLGKVLQILVKHHIVISHKGITGGFILDRNTGKITMNTIVKIMDGDSFLDGCMVGFPNCSDEHPCPVHEEWTHAKNEIKNIFEQKDINQFSDELQSKLDYIAHMNNQQEQEA